MRFPVTGPVRYSMTAQEAVQLYRLVRPRTAIPVHYEGWTHFHQRANPSASVIQELRLARLLISHRVPRWLFIGSNA